MKAFYLKHKALFRYVFFGLCTTAVNWAIHFAFVTLVPAARTDRVLNAAATVLAWICAALFAFFTYKKWVFEDGAWDLHSVLTQLVKFLGSRALTLGSDALLALLLTQPLNNWALLRTLPLIGGKDWVPFLALKLSQALVSMTANYLFSQFLVFNHKKSGSS